MAATPLFVYGSLLGGESADFVLGYGPRRPASVKGRLYALAAGYPAVVLQGDSVVWGELVDGLDERRLALADRYEGVDEGLYQRVRVEALVGLRTESAWIYVMDAARASSGRLLPEGRWRNLRRR